jgi:CHAT domain-containing protein/tetratricopeptide (TPR) repeat protein
MKAQKYNTGVQEELLTKLFRLQDEKSRKNYIDAHPELLNPSFAAQLADAVREHVRVDVTRAMALAECAIAIAERVRNHEALGKSLRAKGNVLWIKGQYRPAVKIYDRAIALFQKAGNASEVGRTLSTSIQPLSLLGEYRRALSVARRASAIFKRTGEDWRLARLEINTANVFRRRGYPAKALARYERAYTQLLPHKDTEGIGVALHNMAVCLINLNDFHKALKKYEEARKFCKRHGMPLLVAQADYNIAYLHYLRSDYTLALQILRKTHQACRENSDPYHSALCNLDQSEIYLELNLIGEAEDLARQAAGEFEQLNLGYEAMKALTNVAIALSRKGDAAGALTLFRQARHNAVAEQNAVWPWIIDLYQATLLLGQGQLAESQRLARAALNFFRSWPLPLKAVICHILLARADLQTNNFKSAHRHCSDALEVAETLGAPILAYQAHLLRGEVYETELNVQQARSSYETARVALEPVRGGLRGDELKIAFMKDRHEVYERLLRISLGRLSDSATADEAFTTMEEMKSHSLRDLLLSRARKSSSARGMVERRVHEMRRELNWYYGRIEAELWSQEIHTSEIQQLQAKARLCEKTLQRILREHSWDSIDPTLRITTTLTPEKIRRSLDKETTLVEYCSVHDRIVAAVMTSENVEIFPLAPMSRVRDLLRSLRFQFSRARLHAKNTGQLNKSLTEATEVHLRALYDEVMAPLRNSLRGHRLVVVPHNVLHHLPFHALFDGSHYLVDSFAVSYAPSASIYSMCHNRRAKSSGRCLILGVPDSRTPYIAQEVQCVAATVSDSNVFVGQDATLDVLRNLGAESRIIHIATHGSHRQDNPLFSTIRLGDSYLNLYDLYDLRLPVQLLTLSGCSTGLNVVTGGDELLGLIRGLLYTGAQSLMLSLWDVNDHSTASLMESFYGFPSNHNKAEALRSAMLEIRDHFPHPYYWAPFVLIGKAS